MTGLDTNVLVRYLTEDDPGQARKAAACINSAVARGERCFLSPVVLCELSWVLLGAYEVSKADLLPAGKRAAILSISDWLSASHRVSRSSTV